MRLNGGRIVRDILFFCASLVFFFLPFNVMAAEEYSFDLEEFESKPFEWGGYAEIKYEHIDLNTDSAFY
ncbi:MAG: hypothetical protein JRJ23_09940, partial [Deltaproteobacteria bacterium]|nr:hypothetical protein [Deltaproteobacteria bacterium]